MQNLIILLFILVFQIFGNNNEIYQKNISGVAIVLSDQGSGSGVILSRSGYVLTNYHVVEKQKQVEIFILGGKTPETGYVVKSDKKKDLALIKIQNSKINLSPIKISKIIPKIGSEAHAIGHPNGEFWTYTKGYISHLRDDYEWSYDQKFIMKADVIQTQTPINGGNSGGPLLNQSGNLIGIATFGTPENEGLNFAIRVEEIIRFLKY